MSIYIKIINSNELHVSFNYSAERVKRIKLIPYHKWDSINKVWVLKGNSDIIQKLKEIYCDEEIIINEKKEIAAEQKTTITNSSQQNMDENISVESLEILMIVSQHLRLKGYSSKTIKSYKGHLRRMLEHFNKEPENITEREIKAYLYELLENRNVSHSYANQAISAIKFLYNDILKTAKLDINLPRPKKQLTLPKVLSFEEVVKILNSLKNLKHIVLLYMVYSAGLRVSEVVGLKRADIDIQRMQIHVVQGKGAKDRYTILSTIAYEKLKLYLDIYKPEVWLFPGANEKGHLCVRSAENIFKSALSNAKINKDVSIHCLRHCFATHLYENGTDLKLIKQYLGHENLKTTEIYVRISDDILRKVRSPLDQLMEKMRTE